MPFEQIDLILILSQQNTPRPPYLGPRKYDYNVCLDESPTLPFEITDTLPDDSPTILSESINATSLTTSSHHSRARKMPIARAQLIKLTTDRPMVVNLSEKALGKLPARDFMEDNNESHGLGLGGMSTQFRTVEAKAAAVGGVKINREYRFGVFGHVVRNRPDHSRHLNYPTARHNSTNYQPSFRHLLRTLRSGVCFHVPSCV